MAKTGSERTTAWRKALIEQGYKQKAFLLSPKAVAALKKVGARYETEREALEALILKAAKE